MASEPAPVSPHRPSLRQVAEAAGVSAMTVSRAFRSDASVRPELRARILQLAGRMGYTPDPRISSVMGAFVRRSQPAYRETLAYIGDPVSADNVFSNRFYQGVLERTMALGYHLDTFRLQEKGMSFSRINRVLLNRNIRGLIIGPPSTPHPHIHLDWPRYAAVAVGSSLWKPRLNRVQHHHFMGMILALRNLRHFGAKRIGLVVSNLMNARTQGSYIASFLINQTGAPDVLHSWVHRYAAWNADRFLVWLKCAKPDVILCGQMDDVRRIESLCRQRQFHLVCLNVVAETPDIAGIDQHYGVLGLQAVDLLQSELIHRKFGLPEHPNTLMIEGSWREGNSLPQRGMKPIDWVG